MAIPSKGLSKRKASITESSEPKIQRLMPGKDAPLDETVTQVARDAYKALHKKSEQKTDTLKQQISSLTKENTSLQAELIKTKFNLKNSEKRFSYLETELKKKDNEISALKNELHILQQVLLQANFSQTT